jgi:predicted DCC family thiol-disulfide oxidoreductase YuxK
VDEQEIARSAWVLFDGGCGLCARSVRFVARHDRGRFRFAPLDGPTARRLLDGTAAGPPHDQSVVLVEGGTVFTRSSAVLRIAATLSWPWRWLAWLRLVPRPVRDAVYDAIARRRVRWFGPASACGLPPESVRRRISD